MSSNSGNERKEKSTALAFVPDPCERAVVVTLGPKAVTSPGLPLPAVLAFFDHPVALAERPHHRVDPDPALLAYNPRRQPDNPHGD